MNPFVFARLELPTPWSAEQARVALQQLVRDGFEADGRLYRLFGGWHGRQFSMSLGVTFVGGSAPVLRATLAEGAGPVRLSVTVGARLGLSVIMWLWALLTVGGGGYQLLVQLAAMAAGKANDVPGVLEAIAIAAGMLVIGHWFYRLRGTRETRLLLDALRSALTIAPPNRAIPGPLH